MGRYIKINTFSDWDSNTIDDISGFKVKLSDVARRWDGIFAAPVLIEPRQPQDFPVTAQKQVVFKDARSEQVEAEGAVTPPDIV